MSIHSKMDILDENDNIVYKVVSKALSIYDKTHIMDANDNEIAYIHAKAISIHQVHYVEMTSGKKFEVKVKLGHPFKNQLEIKELGWKIEGEFAAHNYSIMNEKGDVIANAHIKWFSLHNIYYVDILDESQKELIIAAYIVLEHMLANNESADADISATQN
ncbi:LURP-one-related/scramblase family protein [Candidatus Stoquefichus massiliensis]|uniref:LURP-one-related/scramblase family protein n=1 Tax=Candidatus Stoquefichus massiliensis TaxID=1470350 RepID=UPI0004841DDB|nr:LURP-one-related family protein [Candidatus Stoquefichus massiliensis]